MCASGGVVCELMDTLASAEENDTFFFCFLTGVAKVGNSGFHVSSIPVATAGMDVGELSTFCLRTNWKGSRLWKLVDHSMLAVGFFGCWGIDTTGFGCGVINPSCLLGDDVDPDCDP